MQPGTIGTPNRPTRVTAEELYLGTGSPYNTDVGSLLGVTFSTAQTQDGALVFDGEKGEFGGEVTIWVDGSQHPVTAVEYVDGEGVRRPVIQWHLGALEDRAELPNGVTLPVQVTEDWAGKEFVLPTFINTVQVTEDWSGKTIS